ncbi:YbfB/YjiJ family MFS transporter [Cupriavidus pauculus]|uniref:YbfB/YjiJ family MFS transporter n=1 Tax=Cupriavidus pauculus TaxID=82633 RepID=UPI001EE1DEA3|nr:YbfB/YjiJ family MFS transporter [Cupriavidus pauculus]GJG95289.1 YbfB/YjiJ family MFS transporter [Cupriavidus pauculus]
MANSRFTAPTSITAQSGASAGHPLREAIAAALVLAVAMGFGRFAFTGMYPLMVRDGAMSVATGSLAASANYAGYLLGALLAARIAHARAGLWSRIALAGTVASLVALALPLPDTVLIAVRFAAGVLSALALVCAASWLLHVRARHDGAPLMFSGVGIGIMISAELIAMGNLAQWHSLVLWFGLGVGALVLSGLAWQALGLHARQGNAGTTSTPAATLGAAPLIASYGLAGFGYIITATYLPLFVRDALGQVDPIHVWAVFGLAAAPSCFLWHTVHDKLGTRRAMQWNLGVQALGVVLPALSHSAPAYLASAALVGGTFMGTVTIAAPAARRLAHQVKFNLFAVMTAAYGVGQIVGPLVSTALMHGGSNFSEPLGVAATALVIAATLCAL